jgi:hypothetical protein
MTREAHGAKYKTRKAASWSSMVVGDIAVRQGVGDGCASVVGAVFGDVEGDGSAVSASGGRWRVRVMHGGRARQVDAHVKPGSLPLRLRCKRAGRVPYLVCPAFSGRQTRGMGVDLEIARGTAARWSQLVDSTAGYSFCGKRKGAVREADRPR